MMNKQCLSAMMSWLGRQLSRVVWPALRTEQQRVIPTHTVYHHYTAHHDMHRLVWSPICHKSQCSLLWPHIYTKHADINTFELFCSRCISILDDTCASQTFWQYMHILVYYLKGTCSQLNTTCLLLERHLFTVECYLCITRMALVHSWMLLVYY